MHVHMDPRLFHRPVLRSTPSPRAVRQRLAVQAVIAEPPPAQPSAKKSPGLPHGRVFNFAAGPACLPVEVLEAAQADLLNWQGCGVSVMEMSHRGKEFTHIIQQAEADLRQLLAIPSNYKVYFLQGGATAQFASIPLNLSASDDKVDYIVTGAWSKKAAEEAAKYTTVNVAAKGDKASIPPRDSWQLSPDAKYVAYCDNETIGVGA